MSRAFVKEDIEEPQRVTLRRPASGLPPGALNFMTAEGAQRLRARLDELQRSTNGDPDELAALQQALASARIIEPVVRPGAIVFGSRVTVRKTSGTVEVLHIVGADETGLEPGNVSWVSPLGKALLAAQSGKPFRIPPAMEVFGTVVEIA